MSSEHRQALSTRTLFVVGHGRSGTTILQDCLNLHPQTLLLSEPHIFFNPLERGFRKRFNEMHEGFGNPRSKSTYIADPDDDDATPLEVYCELLARWKTIGEKVACSPVWQEHHYQGYIDFQWLVFFEAQYILVLRDPLAVLPSTLRLHTQASAAECCLSYVRSLEMLLQIYFSFPNCLICPFSQMFDSQAVEHLLAQAGVPFTPPEDLFGVDAIKTQASEIPQEFASLREPILELRDIFRVLKSAIGVPSFQIEDGALMRGNAKELRRQIRSVEEQIQAICD